MSTAPPGRAHGTPAKWEGARGAFQLGCRWLLQIRQRGLGVARVGQAPCVENDCGVRGRQNRDESERMAEARMRMCRLPYQATTEKTPDGGWGSQMGPALAAKLHAQHVPLLNQGQP